MSEIEPKAWTLTNTILAAMGAVIVVLLGLGFNSVISSIKDGDKAIYDQLSEIKIQHKETSHQILEIVKTVATLKANQDARLEREKLDAERSIRRGQP
jgi:phage-related minor tail protein